MKQMKTKTYMISITADKHDFEIAQLIEQMAINHKFTDIKVMEVKK